MSKKKSVHVVLDTNILHTKSPEFFVNSSLSAAIKRALAHHSLEIKWYLPSVVKAERQHQIMMSAVGLIKPVQTIAKLLDEDFNVSEDKLRGAIERRVARQIKDHELRDVELDPARVDWHEMIRRAVSRQAPFEKAQENEKGFRDALILETFDQLHGRIKPRSDRLLVVMSGDGRLREAIEERFAERHNVLIFSKLGELETSLSALLTNITQEAAEHLVRKAHARFLESGQAGAAIGAIRERFAAELARGPSDRDAASEKGFLINETSFLGRTGARAEFATGISILTEAIRPANPPPPTLPMGSRVTRIGFGDMVETPPDFSGAFERFPGRPLSYRESQELFYGSSKLMRFSGQHVFSVVWSANDMGGELDDLAIKDIEYESTTWDEI